MYLSKAKSIHLATKLQGCLEALAYTHTCYAGESPACGKCHSCVLRNQGFIEAKIDDPLIERQKNGNIESYKG